MMYVMPKIPVAVEENCETCRFWMEYRDGSEWGECRKNAPSPMVLPAGSDIPDKCSFKFVTWFPTTMRDEWCGEWKPTSLPSSADSPTEPCPPPSEAPEA
jgi:hypothetical protein